MSEKNPANETPEVTPAPEPTVQVTDAYREISKNFSEAAESFKAGVGDLKNLKELDEKRREESAKMRAATPTPTEYKAPTFDALITRTRAAGDREVKDLHELNDVAMSRALVRAYKAGALPMDAKGQVRLDQIPKEAFGGDEMDEIRAFRAKAAGSFWDSSTGGGAGEWVPTGFSRSTVEFYTIDTDVPALFEQVDIPQGVGDFSVPVETTRAHAFCTPASLGEVTGVTSTFVNTGWASMAQSGVCTFSPKKISNLHQISMEGVEDIIIDSIGRARNNSAKAVRQGMTSAVLNGQVADDAALDVEPGDSGLYPADGFSNAGGDNSLRKHCIVNTYTTAVGGDLDDGDFRTGREAMAKYGARSSELAMIVSPKAYLGLLNAANLLTVDKYGVGATILSGEVAKVMGVPVVLSSEFPEALAAGGVAESTGATTGAVLVNRTRWLFARKRNLTTTLIPQPGMDVVNILTNARIDFKIKVTDEHSAHYFINVT